jgi:WD40 repeat protein
MSAAPDPYKGLRPFEDAEADVIYFFGRDSDREVIVANMMASRLTVLYGEAGVGKSSVLRAGVAHQLRSGPEHFVVVVFDAWKDDPVEALQSALAQAVGHEPMGSLADTIELCSAKVGAEVFVVLDQTEELFLYHDGNGASGGFVDQFADAVRRPGLRASFLLSLREDTLAKLDRFKGQIPNVLGNYLRLDYLDRAAGRQAIVGPIERYNALVGADERVEVEPALVEQVLDEVTAGRVELGQAGRGAVETSGADRRIETPFLQLVMQRLWETERSAGSRVLRLSTLRELGGAEQIVCDHLEGALSALSPAEKDVAAGVFNHLVTPSGTKIAHAVPDLARYGGVGEAELEPVLAALTTERIVRPVAGEDGGPPRYEIYHDVLGEAVLAWRAGHETQRELEREREKAHRRHRRLLIVLGAAAILLAVMAGVTVFALTQRSQARSQARRAEARELEATALSQLTIDPELSLRMGVRAAELEPGLPAERVLREAFLAARERAVLPAGGPVSVAQYVSDGRRILTGSADGKARLYDAGTHKRLLLLVHGAPVTDAGSSADGRLVMTAGDDGTAKTWDARSGKLLRSFRHGAPIRSAALDPSGSVLFTVGGRTGKLWRVASGAPIATLPSAKPLTGSVFSRDGRLVVVFGNSPNALLADARSGKVLQRLDQGGAVTSAAFSPGGRFLVTGGANKTARLWYVRSGRLARALRGHVGQILGVAFSPRGTAIATVSTDWTGRISSASSADLLAQLIGHSNSVVDVAFSHDGRFLATAGLDRTARVWKEQGDQRALLAGHQDAVREASFSPAGTEVLTGSDDGTARLWDPRTQPQLRTLVRVPVRVPGAVFGAAYTPRGDRLLVVGPGSRVSLRAPGGGVVRSFDVGRPVTAAAVTPDGSLVAIGADRGLSLLRASDGRPVRKLVQGTGVTAVAFSPDGTKLASGGSDGSVRIWTVDGRPLRTLTGQTGAITDVAFSPDGSLLASSSRDKTALIWDAERWTPIRALRGHADDVNSVAFSPDGRLVLTASRDHDARLWDAETGAAVQTLRKHGGEVRDASFSPDGRWIVTAGPTVAQLWERGVQAPILPLGLGLPTKAKGPLTSVSFDPTSRVVLVASEDGTVSRYACAICGSLDDLLVLARARLSNVEQGLTPAERKRYLGS